MSEILNKLSWQSAKLDNGTLAILALVWGVVLAAAISSIFSQHFSAKRRFFWIALVIAVPLLGLLVYLPFVPLEARYRLSFKKKT